MPKQFSTALKFSPVSANGPDVSPTAFITGTTNHLVRFSIAELCRSNARFNPIVFVGPSGYGKTLLLRNICEDTTVTNFLNLTAADFARDFATALDLDSLEEFRHRFLDADGVSLDDVQHLKAKTAAQYELCRLLDQLVADNKQIVVTSSLPIEKSDKLVPQLASRLLAGLSIQISPPDLGACTEILLSLLRRFHLVLDNDTMDFLTLLAFKQTKVARGPYLNHLLLQLLAESEAKHQPIDLALAKKLFATDQPAEPSLSAIANTVAKYFHLKPKDIRGASRKRPIVHARGIAMFLARSLTNKSLEEIGNFFGNRDHTTVLHACRRTKSLVNADLDLESLCNELRCSLI